MRTPLLPCRTRLAAALLAATLAACGGGGGGGSSAETPTNPNPPASGSFALSLVVAGLPTGARLPVIHKANGAESTTLADNGSLALTVKTGDSLRLGAAQFANEQHQQTLINCALDAASGNGTVDANGELSLRLNANATQTASCGRTYIVPQIMQASTTDPTHFPDGYGLLRVNAVTGQGSWLHGADGLPVSAAKSTVLGTHDSAFLNGKLLFKAHSAAAGSELWVTDGTDAGTRLLKDINPGTGDATLQFFSSIGDGKVYFNADDGATAKLWETDGTEAGTRSVTLPGLAAGVGYGFNMKVAGGKLFLTDDDRTLWVKDAQGVRQVTSLANNSAGGNLSGNGFFAVGDRVFFSRRDRSVTPNTYTLWVSDGTSAETKQVAQNVEFRGAQGIGSGNIFYFLGYTAEHGYEPWRSDGTAAGTFLLKDIHVGTGPASAEAPGSFTAVNNGSVFFLATDTVHGREVWKSDGTAGGTALVKDVFPGASQGTSGAGLPEELHAVGNQLYFRVSETGAGGKNHWTTDGTEAGTRRVFPNDEDEVRLLTGTPRYWTRLGGEKLLFANWTHSATAPHNILRLWTTDGTASGTVRVTNPQGQQFQVNY